MDGKRLEEIKSYIVGIKVDIEEDTKNWNAAKAGIASARVTGFEELVTEIDRLTVLLIEYRIQEGKKRKQPADLTDLPVRIRPYTVIEFKDKP